MKKIREYQKTKRIIKLIESLGIAVEYCYVDLNASYIKETKAIIISGNLHEDLVPAALLHELGHALSKIPQRRRDLTSTKAGHVRDKQLILEMDAWAIADELAEHFEVLDEYYIQMKMCGLMSYFSVNKKFSKEFSEYVNWGWKKEENDQLGFSSR